MQESKTRKNIRLQGYDYSLKGYYFITICVKNRLKLFWEDVGVALLGDPKIKLTNEGLIVQKNIEKCNKLKNIRIDEYIIMPNHIHMIIELKRVAPYMYFVNVLIDEFLTKKGITNSRKRLDTK